MHTGFSPEEGISPLHILPFFYENTSESFDFDLILFPQHSICSCSQSPYEAAMDNDPMEGILASMP